MISVPFTNETCIKILRVSLKSPLVYGNVVLDSLIKALREDIDILDQTNDVKICSISNYENFNFYDNYEKE